MSLTITVKNYLVDYSADMENDDYIEFMRELAEWASNQADVAEYREETLGEFEEYNEE